MGDTSVGAPVNSDDASAAAADDDLPVVQLALKSRRIGHLLPGAKCILGYLSVWQLSLIACNLLLVVSSAMHMRPHLLLSTRRLYCFYLLFTLALLLWDYFSIAVLVRRRADNLNTITRLSITGLLLLLMDVFFLSVLLAGFARGSSSSASTRGYLQPILEHSEVAHQCLLSASRIVCFLLWMHFANGQLNQNKWTYLERVQTVQGETTTTTTSLAQICSEFA